jgi:adenosylcobinamide amidohydrolase
MDQCHVSVRTNKTGTINIIIIVIVNLSDKINVLDCI